MVRDIIIRRILSYGFASKNAAFSIFTLINISEGEFTNERTKTNELAEAPRLQIEIISDRTSIPNNQDEDTV